MYQDPQTKLGTGIIVTVVDYKNPLIASTGFGFRSRLLGYFVRCDFGWGIDNFVLSKNSVITISLATDF